MATQDRQELVRNAVTFLRDPKAQSSPLTQRIQFLEAKGLTSAEIEEAMRQSSNVSVAPPAQYGPAPFQPAYGPLPYTAQPPLPWDWRDYFITAVVSGTIAYGATALFKKYVLPHLRPPSTTAYEEDRDALTAQFDAAEELLKEIQAETTAVRTAVEEQRTKIDKATEDIESVVKQMREGEEKTRDDLQEIRSEVHNVRDMLPKMIEKSKESHTQSLVELQSEIKSLKTLLLSRGGPSAPTGMSTPIIPTKPSIPAWQLAGANHLGSSSSSSPLPTSPSALSAPTFPTFPSALGKGKETEVPSPSEDAAA